MNVDEIGRLVGAVRAELSRVVRGQDEVIDELLVGLLAGGHVLVQGVPGLGKTLLVRALSHVLGASYKRIQFTPDLMPSDVTGSSVWEAREGRFQYMPGPVFTQLLLADELNRAPAKTQASLLEAMQERSVTSDGVTRTLPAPFFVVATQNPVESHGTYPLPEAQIDRFLLQLEVRHPSREAEREVVELALQGFETGALERFGLKQVITVEELLAMQSALCGVRMDAALVDYAVDLVARTRGHRSVFLGASLRASVGLARVARAHAAVAGRDFVVPDDVKALAPSVLRHRVRLHPDAELEGTTVDDVVASICREAPVPKGAA